MTVVKSGYKYVLPVRRKDGTTIAATGEVQPLTFLETDADGNTVTEGAFTEDVLEALIDSQKTLQEKLPSREGALALTKLQEAKHWLGERQTDRKDRGVHMTHQA